MTEAFKQESIEQVVDAFLDDYEMMGETQDGRDACHSPTESEKALIKDAIFGLMSDDGFMAWQARNARADAPASADVDQLAECPHLIWFDDQDRKPIMLAGAGARRIALKAFKDVSMSWNAHLFVRVAKNCRDDRFPCAELAPTQSASAMPSVEDADLQEMEAFVTGNGLRRVPFFPADSNTLGGFVLACCAEIRKLRAAHQVNEVDEAFMADLARSKAKHPGNARMLDALMGKVDELRRAYVGDGEMRAEAFDVAACAYRIATEGDSGGNTRLNAVDVQAWLFKCYRPGKRAVFASVDPDDNAHWPLDQWKSVERHPLVIPDASVLLRYLRTVKALPIDDPDTAGAMQTSSQS